MPIRSEWKLAREGVTADIVLRLLGKTLFNPVLTLPLILLARYTQKGNLLAIQHAKAFKYLKLALYVGLYRHLESFLGNGVMNNWKNDTYDWKKEVVAVTGGSDGIGAVVVKLLAEKGIKVAVLDVQPLTYKAPPTVHHFHCDLASTASIATACDQIKSTLGAPTILINNAGLARGKPILESAEKDIRLTFNVNSLSHYSLAQHFLPSMISSNHGMIVTIASSAAYISAPRLVDYAASKAAALAFHEGLSAELATVYNAPKVRTVVVCQGYTKTALFEGFEGAGLEPETVAEEIVRAVLSGRSAHVLVPVIGHGVVKPVRSWPFWMQYGLRKRLVSLMSAWKGRQVVQPSLEGAEKAAVESAGDGDGEGGRVESMEEWKDSLATRS